MLSVQIHIYIFGRQDRFMWSDFAFMVNILPLHFEFSTEESIFKHVQYPTGDLLDLCFLICMGWEE